MGLLATKNNCDSTDGKALPLNFGWGNIENANQYPLLKRTLPAEWFEQSVVQLTWPHKNTDWLPYLEEANRCYMRMAYEIASRQPLLIVTPEVKELEQYLSTQFPQKVMANISFFETLTNDTWARDHGFLSVINEQGVELLDFKFNGWGGKFIADKDNAINQTLYKKGILKGTYVDLLDFELEGGSVESDGKGTLLVTSTCLLNPNRNPQYSKEVIEQKIKKWFGVEQVLWLDYGYLEGDDTDAHIDTLARFCINQTIVYVQCADPQDVHYPALKKMEEQLSGFKTVQGEPYQLLPLPMAKAVYENGERLPATYANFLIINKALLFPTYNDKERDEQAKEVLAKAFPKYDIVGIDCSVLIKQHGSLHCATMQYPKSVFEIL